MGKGGYGVKGPVYIRSSPSRFAPGHLHSAAALPRHGHPGPGPGPVHQSYLLSPSQRCSGLFSVWNVSLETQGWEDGTSTLVGSER